MAKLENVVQNEPESGQSLVEYTLIVVLCIFAFAFAIAATGPAIGNVFSNTIYNLIGQSGSEVVDIPNSDGFWLTVTWVAAQTPQETPLATRTSAPGTSTPTPGPSPTPSPTVPSPTPYPSNTPQPSPTMTDFSFTAPWTDTANNEQVIHWRLDNPNNDFGTSDWYGNYYNSANFSGAPYISGENRLLIDPSSYQKLNLNLANNTSPAAGGGSANYSIRWGRRINVTAATTLIFDVPVVRNGGVRVYLVGLAGGGGNVDEKSDGPEACSSQLRRGGSAGQFVRSSDALTGTLGTSGTVPTPQNKTNSGNSFQVVDNAYIAAGGASASECLVIDRWHSNNTDYSISDVRRDVAPGWYTVFVEYAHTTGAAKIAVNVRSGTQKINPDDVGLASNPVDCGFSNAQTTRSDSLDFTWEEYQGLSTTFRPQTRCYLELRGSVAIPAAMADPKFTFWDVWDIQSNVDQWVEIADYDPDNDGVFDRTQLSWQRVNLHQNDTFNYNWTYNTVDLKTLVNATSSRKLAIRFGMERRESGNQPMKWYLDTMTIDNMPTLTHYMNQQWDLNVATQRNDFIASGNWNLSSEFTRGPGMSWHESPTGKTTNMPESRNGDSSFIDGDLRMHTLEFNGFIDLDDPLGTTDYEGDQGDPLLTFWHIYKLGNRTGVEAQYSTTPYGVGEAQWILINDGGQVVSRNNPTTEPTLTTWDQVTVNLKEIPVRRFRLRLAMTVNAQSSLREGWWIDDIKLERLGRIRYLQYPFVDYAEDPAAIQANYNLGGNWARVEGGHRPAFGEDGWSYTDSPSDNYRPNTENTIAFRRVLDLYNDTPESSFSPVCSLGGALCETPNPTPVRPVLSFWHKRRLTSNTSISIEWKRNSENSSNWKSLWLYDANNSKVVSLPGSTSTQSDRTRINAAWERVQVDLAPIYALLLADNANTRTDANKLDDDINIRIRFYVGVATPADGVYFDDIRLEEYAPTAWALWTTGATRTNLAGQPIKTNGIDVVGNGMTYQDTLDNTLWFDIWHVGGGWDAVSFEQRDGVLAFHDSTTVVSAPSNKAPNFTQAEGTNGTLVTQTFNTLEMRTIMDLRGVQTTDRPLLYFWTRWYAGDKDYLALQVSIEDPSNSLGGCPTGTETQCYQKDYGWGPWTNVWTATNSREYLWERRQVDLTPYAKSSLQDGKRIRLRFISDTMQTAISTHRDGWYVDGMIFTYFQPQVTFIGRAVSGGGSFTDRTRSTNNWVTEGRWGLTPTLFRGDPGPTSLGGNPWSYQIWDYNIIKAAVGTSTCNSLGWAGCSDRFLTNFAATKTPWHSGMVTDIRQNWGGSGPVNAGGTVTKDKFVYRWTMTTPANLTASRYTFITAADDGVRLRFDTLPAGGLPAAGPDDPPNYGSAWNIVNNWQSQGRTTTVSSANILGGSNRYTFVMEYFEDSGDASVQLTIGTNSFSFTAQPPNGTGRLESDQVPVMQYSNASIISKGVFDLTQSVNPILRYFTYYELGGTANVEVSQDGGFSWTRTGLGGGPAPASLWATPWWGYYWNTIKLDSANGGWPSPSPTFATQPFTTFNGPTGFPKTRNEGNTLYFNYGSGSPNITGIGADNFSVRFVRKLNTTDFTTLKFTVTGDDGYRLWVNYTPGCAVINGNAAKPVISGSATNARQDATFGNPNTGCLLIDDWNAQSPSTNSVIRTLPPGATIMLDYYESGGGAEIRMDVESGSYDDPQWSGVYMPDDGDVNKTMQENWQPRIHDLSSYAGPGQPPIMLRFRLDRLANNETDKDGNTSNGNVFNYPVGWWLSDFELFEP